MAGKCSAEGLDDLVGRPRGAEVAEAARSRSGAAALRWVAPGEMVTMDFREDRLNLYVDEAGKVTKATCG
ncbi:MAG: I78 family peptidase inhibitor [Sphingomonas sp.]